MKIGGETITEEELKDIHDRLLDDAYLYYLNRREGTAESATEAKEVYDTTKLFVRLVLHGNPPEEVEAFLHKIDEEAGNIAYHVINGGGE